MSVPILLIGRSDRYVTAVQNELSDAPCIIVARNELPPSLSDVTGEQGIVTSIVVSLSSVEACPSDVTDLIRHRWPWASLLLFDGPASSQMATAAMKAGARDYLPKEDSTPADVARAIRRLLKDHVTNGPNNPVIQTVEDSSLIGRSDVMEPIFERMDIAVENTLNVLVQGESGTGKTQVSRAIHSRTARPDVPLFLIDCQFLTPDEARTLFLGREYPVLRSGATPDGWPTSIKNVAEGTVVLENLDAAETQTQDVIAHALEMKAVDTDPKKTTDHPDLRFIGVTSNVERGALLDRLFYRIAEVPISLPPLRERTEDVVPLALHFLEKTHVSESQTRPRFSEKAKRALREQPWPGNVRQLKNVVNRSVRLSSTLPLEREDLILADTANLPGSKTLSERVERSVRPPDSAQSPPPHVSEPEGIPTKDRTDTARKDGDSDPFSLSNSENTVPSLEEVKRLAVKRAYELYDGDVERAAVALDIGRSTMYRMIKRHDLRSDES